MNKKNKSIKQSEIENSPKEIVVNYIKTSNYRSYHIDGIYGGVTPNGKIYAELFIQRSVTPKSIKYKVQDGILKEEIERMGKEGIVREIESGVVMDIETARIFKDWLDSKISEYDKRIKRK